MNLEKLEEIFVSIEEYNKNNTDDYPKILLKLIDEYLNFMSLTSVKYMNFVETMKYINDSIKKNINYQTNNLMKKKYAQVIEYLDNNKDKLINMLNEYTLKMSDSDLSELCNKMNFNNLYLFLEKVKKYKTDVLLNIQTNSITNNNITDMEKKINDITKELEQTKKYNLMLQELLLQTRNKIK